MLRGAGQQSCAVEDDFLTIEVQGVDGDLVGAADVSMDVGDTQATFRAGLFALEIAESRVDEDQRHGCGEVLHLAVDEELRWTIGNTGHINDREHERVADLLGGQPESFGGVHGFQHVGGESSDLGRNAFDAFAFLAEHGMPEFGDFQYHTLSITAGLKGVKVEGKGRACP